MINKKLLIGSALTALVLVGCGGSSDSTSVASTTGYLVDAPVANADYDCVADGVYDQVTGSDGSFTCQNMSQVRFRIGELVLGEITSLPDDNYVFPQDLAGVTRTDTLLDEKVTALAQLLQSLDEDGDPTNGIVIPEDVKDLLVDSETTFTSSELYTYLNSASIDPSHIRTSTEARNHLRDTMQVLGTVTPLNTGTAGGTLAGALIDVDTYPMSTLTQELEDAIAYMGNEERLAYDTYTNLYTYHLDNGTDIYQLQNIASRSEITHIETVQSIVQKYALSDENLTNVINPVANSSTAVSDMPSGQYDIPAIQSLYDALYAKGITSQQDALEVACMVEVTDINDLNNYISLAQASNAPDVEAAFTALRDASYNHYWSFDSGLRTLGVTEGCCSLGTIDGVDYCQPDYPQNSHGNH